MMVDFSEATKLLRKLSVSSNVVVEVITPVGQKTKFKTVFVGFVPEKYVLLQMPDLSKAPKLAYYLSDKNKCTVRGVSEGIEGSVIGFHSKVNRCLKIPLPLLMIDMPMRVQQQSLRKVSRIDTKIQVDVLIDNNLWQGEIRDLSSQGCLVQIGKTESTNWLKDTTIRLLITDYQYKNRDEIFGYICNVKRQMQTVELGLAFAEESKTVIARLVNEVMLTDTEAVK